MRVSAIMTAHREGRLAAASIGSFREAIDYAKSLDIDVESVVILDRADQETHDVFLNVPDWNVRYIVTDYGDLGLGRNRAAKEASGEFITFLDADDLWSFNWIAKALQYSADNGEKLVCHSDLNLVFGDQQSVWIHADQGAPSFDPGYQRIANYWDSLCFCRRQTFIEIPFRNTDLTLGYGHEDWDWNNLTMVAGYRHRPVPGTVHMKRRRQQSLTALCKARDVVVRPSALLKYDTELREMTDAMLNEDARFIFPAHDSYWTPENTAACGLYEPEIEWALRRAADRPYALIDCGANLGYWSVLAASAPYGGHQVVAIEAARANFNILELNLKANGRRFFALHRAVAARSGERVRLFGREHYGMSLHKEWNPARNSSFEEVETITIDEVADRYLPKQTYPALIKIDVEGSEIGAIQGARQLIEQGALLIFEDHGRDRTHAVSRYVLDQEDIAVLWITSELRPVAITGIEQVAAVKTHPGTGYNFFAYRAPSPWSSLFG